MPKIKSKHKTKSKRTVKSVRRNRRMTRRKQRGSGRYNYSLYAYLPDDVATAVKTTTDNLQTKYESYLKWKTNHTYDPPHITIAYGPSIDADEITNKEDIDKVYPGILRFASEGLPIITYSDINTFDRDDKYVLKIQWDSDKLLDMYKYIADTVPEVGKTYTTYASMDGYKNDPVKYYNKMSHTTLCVLDRAKVDSEGNLEDIIKDAISIYSSINKTPKEFSAKNISMISAITDTPVLLW